jgi:hypothetical protein
MRRLPRRTRLAQAEHDRDALLAEVRTLQAAVRRLAAANVGRCHDRATCEGMVKRARYYDEAFRPIEDGQ